MLVQKKKKQQKALYPLEHAETRVGSQECRLSSESKPENFGNMNQMNTDWGYQIRKNKNVLKLFQNKLWICFKTNRAINFKIFPTGSPKEMDPVTQETDSIHRMDNSLFSGSTFPSAACYPLSSALLCTC